METFGSYLKTHREKKGIRLEEIASITKIHLHSLELLESGRWAQLPPEPFIRGFIIAYAKYVGLDPKQAISRYLEEVSPQEGASESDVPAKAQSETIPSPAKSVASSSKQKEAPAPKISASPKVSVSSAPAPKEKTASPVPAPISSSPSDDSGRENGLSSKVGIGAVAVGLALTLAIFIIMRNLPQDEGKKAEPVAAATNEPTVAAAPSPSASADSAASTTPPSSAPAVTSTQPPAETRSLASPEKGDGAAPSQVLAAQEVKHKVVIEGKDRSWVKVVVDDKPPIEFFLKEGQKVIYKANTKIKVVLGNSAGTTVTHNGELSPGVKFQGTIRSYIFPADARFPQDVPKKAPPPPADAQDEQPDQG